MAPFKLHNKIIPGTS